jgi:hypothetical protein
MIIRIKLMQEKVARMVMRTNKLIKINQEMIMNRINLKNYILMEVEGLIETEEDGGKRSDLPKLVSPEDEDREITIKIMNFEEIGMKPKRRITKFQINNLQRKKKKNYPHKRIMNITAKRLKKMKT